MIEANYQDIIDIMIQLLHKHSELQQTEIQGTSHGSAIKAEIDDIENQLAEWNQELIRLKGDTTKPEV